MGTLRLLGFAVLTYLLTGLIGLTSAGGVPANAPVAATADWSPWIAVPTEGAWALCVFATAHPRLIGIVGAVLFAPLLISVLASLIPRRTRKDPVRLFKGPMRATGFRRCADRCEGEIVPFVRCRRRADRGDHWFPWSKGGATDLANFVGLCDICNLRKGATVPTIWQTMRLEARRRRYFPLGTDTRPGSKYARA